MKHFRTHQHLTTWFALWVLLLGLTLPLLGHAGMSRFLGMGLPTTTPHEAIETIEAGEGLSALSQEWVSICTSTGMAWVVLADGDEMVAPASSAPTAPQGMAGGHCLYCVLHDEELALDVQAVWQVLTAFLPWQDDATHTYPPAPAQAFPVAAGHPPLQPRAPPRLAA